MFTFLLKKNLKKHANLTINALAFIKSKSRVLGFPIDTIQYYEQVYAVELATREIFLKA